MMMMMMLILMLTLMLTLMLMILELLMLLQKGDGFVLNKFQLFPETQIYLCPIAAQQLLRFFEVCF